MAGGEPGGVAALERAHGTIDERKRLGDRAAGEHAILAREHQRALQRYLGERAFEPRADRKPGAGNVRPEVVAAHRKIDDGGFVARHQRRKARAIDAQLRRRWVA